MTASTRPDLPTLTVAAVQARSVAGALEANVESAAHWSREAAARGARLVVLPELFLSGYDPETLRDEPDRCDVSADDPRLRPLADVAAEHGVALLVGASVRGEDQVRRLGVLSFASDGRVEMPYAKQHLWDVERDIFTPGSHGASAELDGWQLGLGICYDGCFPEHARAASDAGAWAYVCPMAYILGSEHRRDLYYAARALDNGIYVVCAGLVDACGDLEFSGGTAVYDPQGRVVERLDSGEGLVVADLDPDQVVSAREVNPFDRDRTHSEGERRLVSLGHTGLDR